jgi:hypothetical protein
MEKQSQMETQGEQFATYCKERGVNNRDLCLALLPCALTAKPNIPTSFVMQQFNVGGRELRQVTVDLLMEDVHYAIERSLPVFSPEGLQKLSEHYKRSDVSAAVTRCLNLSSAWMAQQLRERDAAVAKERRKTETLLEKLSNKYVAGDRVYVMLNSLYDPSPVYKIGRTKDLTKRLGTYNTGNPDDVIVVYERKCSDSKLVELLAQHILDHYRSESNREYYCLPVGQIKKVLDHCVDSCDGYRERMMGGDTAPGAAERVSEPIHTVTQFHPRQPRNPPTPRVTRSGRSGDPQPIPTPPDLLARLKKLGPETTLRSKYFT